jgi:hypothetical protein
MEGRYTLTDLTFADQPICLNAFGSQQLWPRD